MHLYFVFSSVFFVAMLSLAAISPWGRPRHAA